MPDEGRTHEQEADAAVSAHPGHARPAAGDRSLHTHQWSVQVDQTQVIFFFFSDLLQAVQIQ